MSQTNLDVLRDRVGVNPDQHALALQRLATGLAAWIVVSGKMCAGKDTVAPALVDVLPTQPVMLRYGNLLRAELDPALDLMRERMRTGQVDMLPIEIAELMNLPLQHARTLVDVLGPEMEASGGTLTSHDRTEGNRTILQNLGDDWRCLDDEDYWARKAAQAALVEIGRGNSVILTGGRFLPDVDLPAAAGAMLLRLEVTRETQLARLRGRDGLDPSPETLAALDHISETALDDYTGFTAHVANDGTLEDCIAESRAAVRAHIDQAAATAA